MYCIVQTMFYIFLFLIIVLSRKYLVIALSTPPITCYLLLEFHCCSSLSRFCFLLCLKNFFQMLCFKIFLRFEKAIIHFIPHIFALDLLAHPTFGTRCFMEESYNLWRFTFMKLLRSRRGKKKLTKQEIFYQLRKKSRAERVHGKSNGAQECYLLNICVKFSYQGLLLLNYVCKCLWVLYGP